MWHLERLDIRIRWVALLLVFERYWVHILPRRVIVLTDDFHGFLEFLQEHSKIINHDCFLLPDSFQVIVHKLPLYSIESELKSMYSMNHGTSYIV
jgi:hypothetical protein